MFNNPREFAYIYVLCDPRTQEIRYVGRAENLRVRYDSHLNPDYLIPNTPKNLWLRDLLSCNLLPEMYIISHVPANEAQHWEQYWLDKLRGLGLNLVNSRNAKATKPRNAPSNRILKTATEYIGVFLISRNETYRVKIRFGRNNHRLGDFGREIKRAALLYNYAAEKLYGEDAILNNVELPHPKIDSFDLHRIDIRVGIILQKVHK